jgi:hypothetical protein
MIYSIKNTLAVLLLLVTIISCSKDEDPVPTPPLVYEGAELSTRNYITSDLTLDFFIDTTQVASGLGYGFGDKSAFEWVVDAPGVQFSILDASDKSSLFSAGIGVEKDATYYAAVVGPAAAGAVVLAENDKTLPQDGNVRMRILHAYQDIGAIDVYIGGTAAENKVITNLGYSGLSTYVEVSHTDVSTMIICTETGVLPDAATNLLNILENTSHEANKIYLNAVASATIDATSAFSLFVTEQ